MKRSQTTIASLCAAAMLCSTGFAQDPTNSDTIRLNQQQNLNQRQDAQDLDRGRQVQTRKVTPRSNMMTIKASELTGMAVRNQNGEDLGSVNDFLVTMPEGKIRYLAVSYGGFLGLGDKLFAIPTSSFEVRRDADSDTHYLVISLSEERLKNAPGFDQSNWPDTADAQWQQGIDRYYSDDAAPQNNNQLQSEGVNR